MAEEISSEEWIVLAKKEFVKQGVALPEEDEIWELCYMECMEANQSIEEYALEQKKLQ